MKNMRYEKARCSDRRALSHKEQTLISLGGNEIILGIKGSYIFF